MRYVDAVVVAAVALVYLNEARSFDAGFIADPIGPRAFPFVIGALALAASAFLFRQRPEPRELPDGSFVLRAAILVLALTGYVLALDEAGFVLATTLLMTVLVWIFRGRLLPGAAGALLLSFVVYALFVYAFSIPLPFGRLFGGT
jgi:putative tricarboxylic transport membrane protein